MIIEMPSVCKSLNFCYQFLQRMKATQQVITQLQNEGELIEKEIKAEQKKLDALQIVERIFNEQI